VVRDAGVGALDGLAAQPFSKEHAAGWAQALFHGRASLWPVAVALAATLLAARAEPRRSRANGLVVAGVAGFVYTFAQGFVVRQDGMGVGAALVLAAFAAIFALGLAGRGAFKGDGFVAGSVVGIALLVALFTFFPSSRSCSRRSRGRTDRPRSPRSASAY
jgi:iron(III) transport system permease protein